MSTIIVKVSYQQGDNCHGLAELQFQVRCFTDYGDGSLNCIICA
jgi:hypothetical protein